MVDNKLYYTDPLAAAYMAREFGVVSDHSRWDDDYLSSVLAVRDSDDVYFVGTDSYHIFEPRGEDTVSYDNSPLAIVDYGHGLEVRDNHHYKLDVDLVNKIIQRDNKPFFMPEVG